MFPEKSFCAGAFLYTKSRMQKSATPNMIHASRYSLSYYIWDQCDNCTGSKLCTALIIQNKGRDTCFTIDGQVIYRCEHMNKNTVTPPRKRKKINVAGLGNPNGWSFLCWWLVCETKTLFSTFASTFLLFNYLYVFFISSRPMSSN